MLRYSILIESTNTFCGKFNQMLVLRKLRTWFRLFLFILIKSRKKVKENLAKFIPGSALNSVVLYLFSGWIRCVNFALYSPYRVVIFTSLKLMKQLYYYLNCSVLEVFSLYLKKKKNYFFFLFHFLQISIKVLNK